jgi:hypothetical protein
LNHRVRYRLDEVYFRRAELLKRSDPLLTLFWGTRVKDDEANSKFAFHMLRLMIAGAPPSLSGASSM